MNNSFKFVEKAIDYEIVRQIDVLESGGTIKQETRLYDPAKNETRSMRTKEEANDYRYFPDPDLLPVILNDEFIDKIKATLPELPPAKAKRFMTDYSLSAYDAKVLTMTRELADYFESTIKQSGGSDPKLVANWVTGELLGALNRAGLDITESPIDPIRLGGLIKRIQDNTISGKIGKTVFEALWETSHTADEVIEKQGLKQITDSGAIEGIVDEVLKANPDQVAAFKSGKDKLFGFFVGQVMKVSGGKANPDQVNALLKKRLS